MGRMGSDIWEKRGRVRGIKNTSSRPQSSTRSPFLMIDSATEARGEGAAWRVAVGVAGGAPTAPRAASVGAPSGRSSGASSSAEAFSPVRSGSARCDLCSQTKPSASRTRRPLRGHRLSTRPTCGARRPPPSSSHTRTSEPGALQLSSIPQGASPPFPPPPDTQIGAWAARRASSLGTHSHGVAASSSHQTPRRKMMACVIVS